jgi:hypothetical protein
VSLACDVPRSAAADLDGALAALLAGVDRCRDGKGSSAPVAISRLAERLCATLAKMEGGTLMTAPTLDLITTAHREPNLDWLLRAETPADAYRQRRTSRFVTEFFPEGWQIEDATIWTLPSPDGPPGRVDWGDCPRLPVRSTAQAADLEAASRPSTKEFPS